MTIYTNAGGKEVPFELVDGVLVTLRYYSDVKTGRFRRLETVGRKRWKHLAIFAESADGTMFNGPMFWFSPATEEEKATFQQAIA